MPTSIKIGVAQLISTFSVSYLIYKVYLSYLNFISLGRYKILRKKLNFLFDHENIKKTRPQNLHTYVSLDFFSLQPKLPKIAQN